MHLPTPAALGQSLARSLRGGVNPVQRLDGQRFDPRTPFGPPAGRHSTVHYGVMISGLPEPHRFLDVVAIIGRPPVPIWQAACPDKGAGTAPRDAVTLLTATGAMTAGQLIGLDRRADCDFSADGSRLRFGDRVVIEGRYPEFAVRVAHPEVASGLVLRATDVVTHFARLPGGLYDHWSLLCRYVGRIGTTDARGLCTLEYARGAALPLPLRSFAYSIINVDDRTQLLMGQVLGPGGLPVQQVVHVRGVDLPSRSASGGFHFTVRGYEDGVRTAPDGRQTRLPKTFGWGVSEGPDGRPISIEGTTCGDFTYGLGAGYAGSYRFTGTYAGRSVEGTGYLEYIDRGGPG